MIEERGIRYGSEQPFLRSSSFGAATKEHEKLFYNDAGFLLVMAIADDALFGYEFLEDVRAQEIPAGQDAKPAA